MDDLAELARGDELARRPHAGHEAVVEARHVDDARRLGGLPRLPRLGRVAPERLLAEDVLAGPRGRDRRLGVERVRAPVHEQPDALVRHLLAPVGDALAPAEPCARPLAGVAVAPAERDELAARAAASSCRVAASARECASPMKA